MQLAITVMLAEGHLLIEDVPGVGKTMLAKALARSVDCSVRRVQFTPDLLPSDITGVSIYNQERREFEFKPGAIFANIVVGDEINRASPEDPVGAAGVHGGAPGHRRRRDLRARRSRSWWSRPRTRSRWRAPTRSPRRSATGSWRGSRWATRTSRPSWRCSTPTARRSPLDDLEAVSDATEIADLIRRRARASTSSDQVRQYAVDLVHRDPQVPRAAARRLAARDPAPDPGRPRRRRARRPRLRAARRRPGPRGRRARPPAAADRRVADRPAHAPRTSSPTSWRAVPAARRRTRGPAERASSARRAPGADHPRALVPGRRVGACWSRPSSLGAEGPAAGRRPAARAAAGQRAGRGAHALPAVVAAPARLRPARPPARRRAVTLRLENISRLPTGLLLVEDRVPYVLGSRPRFVLDRVEPRGRREVTYTVRSDVRGRYSSARWRSG